MTKRRGHGEGSIYQRKDGRYVASMRIEGTGSRRKYFYGKTRTEVREKLLNAQLDQKQRKLATGPMQTIKQFLERWLEDVHRPHIRTNTLVLYRQLLDNHLIPALGQIRLHTLSAQHIDELYARKLKEGYAAETVRAIHRVLHRALQDAVKWGLVSTNVSDQVEPPRPVKYEFHPLNGEQTKQLLEAAKGGPLEAMLTLAVATGMRRGELLALRWADIDVEEKCLWVRHTMNRAWGHGLIENAPKTESSKRKIVLPQFVLDAHIQHRSAQGEIRTKANGVWQDRDIVFSNDHGGYLEPSNLDQKFKHLLRKVELPNVRFHDLRHSAATILLMLGVHPKQVQELLGHSSITITMDRYSQVLPTMQREMMDKLDSWFER